MIDIFGLQINIIDLTFLIILLISALIGYQNGFIKELVSIMIWLFSLVLAENHQTL